MSEAKLDKILAELGRLSVQVGDLTGDVARLETRFDGLEARFDGLEAKFDRLGVKVDTLQSAVSQAVNEFTNVWRGLHGAASSLDVPDPLPDSPVEVEVDELREAMRSASRSILDLPEPPPEPPPPPPRRRGKPWLKVVKNPGGPKRPRKPRPKK